MSYRVVHLTSVHHAFDNRIFHKECRSLVLAGYEVFLVAPHECDAARDGIRLVAVPRPRSRAERMTRVLWNIFRTALKLNGDIYHFHDPELMPVGVLLKLLGKKVVCDVHEDYPSLLRHTTWIPSLLRRPVAEATGIAQMLLAHFYDRIIVTTPVIAARFPVAKTHLVQNFPWLDEMQEAGSRPYQERDAIAIYVGRLSNDRGLREMAQATEIVARQMPVKLITAGEAAPGVGADLIIGCENGLVEHCGLLGRAEVTGLAAAARVGLVVLHPLDAYVKSQPTKLYEYMAAGLPVIASDFPIWRRIVDTAGCGLLVNPLVPAEIAKALLWLLQNPREAEQMGMQGRRAALEMYSWESEARYLISAYDGLCRPVAQKIYRPASAE